jgi:F-type H+-transporting ATPase subunit delta
MRGQAAKRYARARLEIGIENSNHALLHKQVHEVAKVYESSAAFRAIVTNPSVTVDERRKVVDQIAQRSGWNPMIRNFSLLLLDNDRFDHIEGIAAELDDFVDVHSGNVRAHVTTASALKDSQVATIKGAIAKLTGKNVLLETSVDPAIMGGVVTRVGSTLYDGSVRTQLDTLRESILDEV